MAESAEKIADCTGGMKVLITLAAKRNVGHFFVSMNGENGKMREQEVVTAFYNTIDEEERLQSRHGRWNFKRL